MVVNARPQPSCEANWRGSQHCEIAPDVAEHTNRPRERLIPESRIHNQPSMALEF